ncbi:SLATT domain-containing protein [Paraclostridium bifermentans]
MGKKETVDINNKNSNKENCGNKSMLKELRRKVDITYRTRVNASNRLREKYQYYKKLNIYYSILITTISVISMGKPDTDNTANIVLSASIALTYYMLYVSEQNLQERAYKMEVTFKELGSLVNIIDLEIKETKESISKLFDRYSNIIASIENHEPIDYYNYKVADIDKKFEKGEDIQGKQYELYLQIKKKISIYKIKESIKRCAFFVIPLIASVWIAFK